MRAIRGLAPQRTRGTAGPVRTPSRTVFPPTTLSGRPNPCHPAGRAGRGSQTDRLLTGKPSGLVEAMGAGERPWARRPAEQPLLPAVPHAADQDGTSPQEPRPENRTWRRHWQPRSGLRCAPRAR